MSLALFTACGPSEAGRSHLKDLSVGMPKDSALAAMGTGPITASTAADSFRVEHGFRRMVYLVDGKQYEVVYVRDEPGNVSEPVTRELETPVVLGDGKVLGWGWKYYDNEAVPTLRLPMTAPKAQN